MLNPLVELYWPNSDTIILKAEEDLLQVRGPGMSRLIMALDGTMPTTALSRIHGAGRVHAVLSVLGRRGLLVGPNDQAPSWFPSTIDPGVLAGGVITTCPAARWFGSALALVAYPLRANARIVITDSYYRPGLAVATEGGPWLLVKVGVGSVWVSPVFAEGRAPCWNCVLTRVVARDDRLALLMHGGYRQVTLAVGSPPAAAMFARESVVAVANQIEQQLTERRDTPVPGHLVRITLAAEVSVHPVVPVAGCVACRRAMTALVRAVDLSLTPGLISRGAGLWDRTQTRLGPLVDSITGIVSEPHVYPATPDNAVAVAVATYAKPSPGTLSRTTTSASSGPFMQDQVSARFGFGGGVHIGDARARAVLEAVERYCTIAQGDESDCHASLADLGDSAIHPNDLMCFAADQLASRSPTAGMPGGLTAPRRYIEDITLHWCTAISLTGLERRFPVACCYRVPDDDPDSAYCVYDSNGSAVAFSTDDAVVSGFLEVIERDAVAIWWYNKIARPVARYRPPTCRALMRHIGSTTTHRTPRLSRFSETQWSGRSPVSVSNSWKASRPHSP